MLEILEAACKYEIAGCISADPARPEILGYPHLGTVGDAAALFASGVRHAFVAIGDNAARQRVTLELQALGFTLASAIHPSAVLSPRLTLGAGIAVMPGVVVNSGTRVGDGAIINTGATVDHDCLLGPFTHVAPGCNLAGHVEVGEGAFLGIGVRVIPQRRIGTWTTVGAGGVVVHDLPERVTAVGVPARALRPS